MTPPLQISQHDWLQAKQILAVQVPQLEVWAFGSRVSGHAKPYSDLDLALITVQALTLAQLADITDAFDHPRRCDGLGQQQRGIQANCLC